MSGLKNIVFVSGNAGKIKEVAAIFGTGFNLINHDIDLPEIQSLDGKDVIKEKLNVAVDLLKNSSNSDFKLIKEKFKELGVNVNSLDDFVLFCEDTSFIIDTLSNAKAEFPGALIKFYFKAVGNKGIIERDGDSKAKMVTYVGALIKGMPKIFEGTVTGRVPTKFTDEGTFGFDPSFIPDLPKEFSTHQGLTNAELNKVDETIKNKTSARALAVNALIASVSSGGGKKKSSKKGSKKMTGVGKKKSSKKVSKKMTGGGKKKFSKKGSKKSSKKSGKKMSSGGKKKSSKKASKKSSKKQRKH
jgi:inosine/xanthosine triphosphate pyrophosphatase family protein